MDILNLFLKDNQALFDLLFMLFVVVYSVLIFIKTKDINKLKEVLDMFKTMQTATEANKASKGQTFDQFKTIYRFNKATNQLEATDDKVDIVELIQSFKNTTLGEILDKFQVPIGSASTSSNNVLEYEMQDNLDSLIYLGERAQFYKDKFKLDPNLSIQEVFSVVKDKSLTLSKEIDTLNNKETNVDTTDYKSLYFDLINRGNGGVNNEKENVEISKS